MIDEKLARGLARSDARRLDRAMDGLMRQFHDNVTRAVHRRFAAGRRLTPKEIAELLDETDRIVGTGMLPLRRESASVEPTRARPNGGAHERLSIHVGGSKDEEGRQRFDIWSFRMLATARRFAVDIMHTGIRFHLHTVQRVIQRTDDGIEAPVEAVAAGIMAHAGRLSAAIDASRELGCDVSLAVPFGHGMLAGTIEENAPDPERPLHRGLLFGGWRGDVREGEHPFLDDAAPRMLTFRTYVPGELMRPRQSVYTDRWNDLDEDHPALEAAAADRLWPTRQLWRAERAPAAELDVARRAVRSFVFDPLHRLDADRRTKEVAPARVREPDESAPAPALR